MHIYANPAHFQAMSRWLIPWLFFGGLAVLCIGAACGLLLTPADYLQGETVRILYVHVPAAWLGMGGWAGLTLAGLAQMVWRHPLAGVAGRAIAVPGALFTALCLVTGSIWGKPTWGTWWEWDGRMTSMLILLFLYLGYIALNRAVMAETRDRGPGAGRITAIFALVGAINLPIINRSVVWWHSLHQGPSITLRGSSIDLSILWPLGLTLTGFSLWFGAIVLMRMRAILAMTKIEARMARMARQGGTL